jgi:hypothetical protein
MSKSPKQAHRTKKKPRRNKSLALEGKRKPRGKPFEKGNKLGPRFPPGVSGNPGGRSKLQLLTAELNRQLPKVARKLIANALRRALKRNSDLELIWNRAEGAVTREGESGALPFKVVIINGEHRPVRPPTTSIPQIPGLPAPRIGNPPAQESPRHLLGSP